MDDKGIMAVKASAACPLPSSPHLTTVSATSYGNVPDAANAGDWGEDAETRDVGGDIEGRYGALVGDGRSKSKASSEHPPSGLRMSWVDRRCCNPAHTCTNRVAVVVTLNHGDARMGIDNSRMLRDSLNELLEELYCTLRL